MSHTFASNRFAQITVSKIKSKSVLAAAHTHNSREKERLGTSNATHIDDRRIQFNETIVSTLSIKNVWQTVVERITGQSIDNEKDIERLTKGDLHYADGKKVRKDAVLATEFEMGYPGDLCWYKLNSEGEPVPVEDEEIIDHKTVASIEDGGKGYFLWPEDMTEFEEWKKRSIEFLKDNFHEENLISVEVHMDETFPHVHALMVPLTENEHGVEKLSCESLFKNAPNGNLSNYMNLQNAYASRFEDMGYKRGQEFSTKEHGYHTYRQSVREIAKKVLSESLPDDRVKAQEMYTAALAKNAMLEEELSLTRNRSAQYSDLAKRHKRLKEEFHELKHDAAVNQSFRTMRECERIGMENHPDKEMIEDIYKPLQNSLIESGRVELEKRIGAKIDFEHDEFETEQPEIDETE